MDSTSNALQTSLERIRKNAQWLIDSIDSPVSESAIKDLLKEGALSLTDMKSFNRAAMFTVEQGKQKVNAALVDADARHLELQNLLYEKAHLLRQIQKCREFPTPEFDKLALVPVEEMVMAAASMVVVHQSDARKMKRKRTRTTTTTKTKVIEQKTDGEVQQDGKVEIIENEEGFEEEGDDDDNGEEDDDEMMEKSTVDVLSSDLSSLPLYVTILKEHHPRLLEVAIEACISLRENQNSRKGGGSGGDGGDSTSAISKELLSLRGEGKGKDQTRSGNNLHHQHEELHELILAQLNHELEQRKCLEEDLEKAKAKTTSLREKNKARALFIEDLPKKLEPIVKSAALLQSELLEKRPPVLVVEGSVLEKHEDRDNEDDGSSSSRSQGKEKRRRIE
jgi:hypothetical protein